MLALIYRLYFSGCLAIVIVIGLLLSVLASTILITQYIHLSRNFISY